MKILVSSFTVPTDPGKGKAGVGRHILKTLEGIATTDLGHTYDVFLPSAFSIPSEWLASPWTTWHPIAIGSARDRVAWEHHRVAGEARRLKADVLFSSFAAVPFRSSVPMVAVIHDAFPRTHPEGYGPRKRLILDGLHLLAAKRSRRIVTVSEWSRGEIARAYRIPESKIVVAYNGPGNDLSSTNIDLSPYIPNDESYLFALSTLEPRKNLVGLLEGFAKLKPQRPDLKLVVAGSRGWKESPIFAAVGRLGLTDDVIFTGYIPDEAVGPLIRRAELFVLASTVEGFGIPALEAMSVGAPIACSNTSSLPEVVGDTAFLFDPASPDSIAQTLGEALADPESRKRKGEEGRLRSRNFSWDRSLRGIERAWTEAVS